MRAVDSGVSLAPDSARVVTRFFVPGHEDSGPGDSRATAVVERVLAIATVSLTELVDSLSPT